MNELKKEMGVQDPDPKDLPDEMQRANLDEIGEPDRNSHKLISATSRHIQHMPMKSTLSRRRKKDIASP